MLSSKPQPPTWFARNRKRKPETSEPLFTPGPKPATVQKADPVGQLAVPACAHDSSNIINDVVTGYHVCGDCGEPMAVMYDYRPTRDCGDDQRSKDKSSSGGGGVTLVRPDEKKVTMRAVVADSVADDDGELAALLFAADDAVSTHPPPTVEVLATPTLSSSIVGGDSRELRGAQRVIDKEVQSEAATNNTNTMGRFIRFADRMIVRLGLATNEPLRADIYSIGQRFLAIQTAANKQIKSAGNLCGAVICRVLGERYMGYQRAEIVTLMANDCKVARSSTWRDRLHRSLSLPKLDRNRTLDGFLNRFTALEHMTPIEQTKVHAIASWVKFVLAIGDVLPPIGINGAPYANTGVNGPWASAKLRPLEGKEEKKKAMKKMKKASVRKYDWLTPLINTGLSITTRSSDPAIQSKAWKKQLMSRYAIAALDEPAHLLVPHLEPLWALNRANAATLAVAIIWLVSQQRTTTKKRGQKRADPEPVPVLGRHKTRGIVLHRLPQATICATFKGSRQSLARAKSMMRDLYYCLM